MLIEHILSPFLPCPGMTYCDSPPLLGGFCKFLMSPEWASLVAQMVKNLPTMQETQVDPWVGKSPWRRERLPTPVFWPGESHGQKSLVDYSLCYHKESEMSN